MPFTPGNIERGIKKSCEKKLGEEGILHRVSLNDEKYFAKQWRGKHYGGEDKLEISFAYQEAGDRTPVSPFWHKLKYYESALIHDAFPENTLKISAGYDARIKKVDDEHRFTFHQGRPVTIAKEVLGDPVAQKRRDEIIDGTYEKYFNFFKPDEYGVLRSTNRRRTRDMIFDADEQMQDAFGRELSISGFDWSQPKASLKKLADEAREINPGSIMVRFFESGLLPAHPEFNFIPISEKNAEGPQGIFIEMAIADIDSLRAKLLQSGQSLEKVDKKIERHTIYRILDDLYDEILLSQNFTGKESLRNDLDIVNTVFQILNSLRERIDKQGLQNSNELIKKIRTNLRNAFQEHKAKKPLLDALLQF